MAEWNGRQNIGSLDEKTAPESGVEMRRVFLQYGTIVLFGCLSGCSPDVAILDRREQSDILMQRALAKAQTGDTEGAIHVYQKILDLNPSMARAHLDIAILFDDNRNDPIRAIYHYQRYLELRPATEKRTMIESRMRLARHKLMSTLQKKRLEGSPEDIAELKRQNAELRDRIAQLQVELEKAKAVSQARACEPTPPRPIDKQKSVFVFTANPQQVEYVVQPGDTLHTIARRYGIPLEWLAATNRLHDRNRIRIGQRLIIPVPSQP